MIIREMIMMCRPIAGEWRCMCEHHRLLAPSLYISLPVSQLSVEIVPTLYVLSRVVSLCWSGVEWSGVRRPVHCALLSVATVRGTVRLRQQRGKGKGVLGEEVKNTNRKENKVCRVGGCTAAAAENEGTWWGERTMRESISMNSIGNSN